MILSAEQKCLLWLSAAEAGAKPVRELMEAYGGAEGIWESFGGDNSPGFHPITRARLAATHTRDAIDDMCARLDKLNVRLLFDTDDEYPALLSAIDDPPYLLYYAGRLSCLGGKCVAVVGTRTPSSYGREMARSIARGLCEAGVCVVSGLALGIDEAAHAGALEAGGRTAGILGSGINNPYPAEHRAMLRSIAGAGGLIMSEYPLDSEPLGYHFPHRNRIISGLSEGVVFVEGRIKSGGMRTVTTALAQGREVFAVPGRVGTTFAEGPHTILREGARIVTCARDILDDIGAEPPVRGSADEAEAPVTPLQGRMLDALRAEPMSADELSQRLGLASDALVTELGTLEIMGLVTREAGNRFACPIAHHRRGQ